jgi:hypothetical protein
MPLFSRLLIRRLGPVGVALTVYDVWKHLPAKQRQQLLERGLTHGSRAARYVTREASKQLHQHRA